jgi:hypothetical protein
MGCEPDPLERGDEGGGSDLVRVGIRQAKTHTYYNPRVGRCAMVHAIYARGDHRARGFGRDGGYWKTVDPRTPHWYFTADTRREVLEIWHQNWREVSRGRA